MVETGTSYDAYDPRKKVRRMLRSIGESSLTDLTPMSESATERVWNGIMAAIGISQEETDPSDGSPTLPNA